MSNRNWEDFGEEILKLIQDAVDSKNFEKLSESIRRTVERSSQRRAVPSVQSQLKAPSGVPAVLGMVFGYGIGIEMLGAALVMLLASFVIGGIGSFVVGIVTTLVTGGIGAACLALGISGTKKMRRIGRFKKYARIIGENEYCNIAVLAAGIGQKDETVIKDVEYMIKNRWFKQGHLDKSRTCLMLTDRMYQQYLQLEHQKELQQKEQEITIETVQKEENGQKQESGREKSSEVQAVVALGEEYLAKIRACNDAIPGEEISAKISRIEMLVDKIFARIEQYPKKIPDIRKMMDYYLPMTVKLLDAYAQMDAQPVGGENIRTAKKEIEETLDTLNIAFEKLLDSLFQETAWDVSSDISVLNTILAQDGLKDDGLKKN